jgi:inorganic pyrophosphatase
MNLETLPAYDARKQAWRVVVETPSGCVAKYRYAPELGTFEIAHFLPEGFAFPYSFGFIPSTQGGDGDPLDVLLLADTPIPPGCCVWARLVGVVEGKQKNDGKTERNDRLIGVATQSRRFGTIERVADLGPLQTEDLGRFFEEYNRVLGRTFRLLRISGAKTAVRLARKRNVVTQEIPDETMTGSERSQSLSLKEAAEYLLEECRMVLPGIQALFGFQLVAVFSADFRRDLSPSMQRLHLFAIGLVAVAVAMVMAPAAFHRQTDSTKVTRVFLVVSARLLLWAMGPLAIGICLDFFLIATIIVGNPAAGIAGAFLAAVFVAAWFVLPRWRGSRA